MSNDITVSFELLSKLSKCVKDNSTKEKDVDDLYIMVHDGLPSYKDLFDAFGLNNLYDRFLLRSGIIPDRRSYVLDDFIQALLYAESSVNKFYGNNLFSLKEAIKYLKDNYRYTYPTNLWENGYELDYINIEYYGEFYSCVIGFSASEECRFYGYSDEPEGAICIAIAKILTSGVVFTKKQLDSLPGISKEFYLEME